MAFFLVAQVNVVLALVIAVGIMLGGAVVVFARAEYLLHILIVIPLIEGISLGPITIGRVASVGALGAVLGLIVLTDWKPVRTPLQLWLPSIALVSWAILSGLWAQSSWHYAFGLGQLAVAVSVLVVTALTLRGLATFNAMLRTYVIVAALTVVPATLQAMAGLRAVGLHANPNQYARALVLALLALAYLVKVQGFTRSRSWLFLAPVLVWGTMATGSRSGLLVLLGAGLLIAYDLAPRKNRAAVMAGAVVVLAVGFVGVVSASERFDPTSALEDRGASRLDIWLVAVRQIDDAPIQGMGLSNFRSQAVSLLTSEPGVAITGGHLLDNEEGLAVHNQYLDFLVNLGIVGLGLYVWTVGRAGTGIWYSNPEWRGAARIVLLQMLAAVSFTLLFGSAINNKHLWMLIGISIAMNALPSRSDDERGPRVSTKLERRDPDGGLQVR